MTKKEIELLRDSADKLQTYREDISGDYNDSLEVEMYAYLEKRKKEAVK